MIIKTLKDIAFFPNDAKLDLLRDYIGLLREDPLPQKSINASVAWLKRAQDNSVSKDGGVSRHFSYKTGWGPSYPETTGYIIPTLIRHAKETKDSDVKDRVERMLNWLVSIQLPQGGFQAGTIDAKPVVPCTFNTGQILLGLASGTDFFGDAYRKSMIKAADWLVDTQDEDGCWRQYPTPFAKYGEKTYETHVAWGLFEAAKIDGNEKYVKSAVKNLDWALTYQNKNGWFENCCLSDPSAPLTHTLGYVFRGFLEGYHSTNDNRYLDACVKIADGLTTAIRPDGFLPGRLDANWNGIVKWVCLTGNAQIAYCLFSLYEETKNQKYLECAKSANKFVRRTQILDGNLHVSGGVKGSYPGYGEYGKYEFLNWAPKFLIDSNKKELEITKLHQI